METQELQQTPAPAQPTEEHRWLERLLGEWTNECEAVMEPGQPPVKTRGTETVRSLGGLWIVGEGHGEMPCGGEATMLLTLGYDPSTKRYVGTWIGSMMTHLWIYDGSLSGNVLTLEADGPDFGTPGKMAKYRDIIEMKSDDHRTLTSQALGEDGRWHSFMTAHYRRKK